MLEMEANKIIVLLAALSVVSLFQLWSVVHSIYRIKRNNKGMRKERKEIPFIKKLLLIGYAERAKRHTEFAKGVCYIYWVYIVITFICIILYGTIGSNFYNNSEFIFKIFAFFRLYIMDGVIIVFFMIASKHGKNGGVVWRWEE